MEIDLSALHGHLVARAPLIQNITNTVVQEITANVLLAIGASPAMIDHEADAAQFAAIADGILINFGTASNQQLLAADAASAIATKLHKPWVLDPISAGVLDFRTIKIQQMAARHPTVIRGNASEIMALAQMGAGGRGVDSSDAVEAAIPAAIALAQRNGGVIAISGERDAVIFVDNGKTYIARIGGGHHLMTRVVGVGCSLGAVVAAYLAAQQNREDKSTFEAVIGAHAHFALAGSAAARKTSSPGSFAVAFIDALYELSADDLAKADIEFSLVSLT